MNIPFDTFDTFIKIKYVGKFVTLMATHVYFCLTVNPTTDLRCPQLDCPVIEIKVFVVVKIAFLYKRYKRLTYSDK